MGHIKLKKKIRPVAYKLKLPVESRVHLIFHVSFLKKHIREPSLTTPDLPPFSENGHIVIKLEAILDSRWIKRGSKIVAKHLIKWKHLPIEDATWEDDTTVSRRFLNLEGKVPPKGESIDEIRRFVCPCAVNPK